MSLVQAKPAEYYRSIIKVNNKQESHESSHCPKIIKSLINKALGLETDFTAHQFIELTLIFRRVMKTNNVFMMRLLRIWDNLHYSKANKKDQVLQRDELEAVIGQIRCLKEFTDCLNLEVIARRLSSPKVRVEIQLNGGNCRNLVVSSRKKGDKYSKNLYYLSSSLRWLRMRLFI